MYDNQGDVMESIIKQSLLYDFYGELLTEHQRTVYEDAVFNDMSLGEIAEEQGISRQGVHDLIKRCDKILSGYEEKLHLVQKFQQTRQMVEDIQERTRAFHETKDESLIAQNRTDFQQHPGTVGHGCSDAAVSVQIFHRRMIYGF